MSRKITAFRRGAWRRLARRVRDGVSNRRSSSRWRRFHASGASVASNTRSTRRSSSANGGSWRTKFIGSNSSCATRLRKTSACDGKSGATPRAFRSRGNGRTRSGRPTRSSRGSTLRKRERERPAAFAKSKRPPRRPSRGERRRRFCEPTARRGRSRPSRRDKARSKRCRNTFRSRFRRNATTRGTRPSPQVAARRKPFQTLRLLKLLKPLKIPGTLRLRKSPKTTLRGVLTRPLRPRRRPPEKRSAFDENSQRLRRPSSRRPKKTRKPVSRRSFRSRRRPLALRKTTASSRPFSSIRLRRRRKRGRPSRVPTPFGRRWLDNFAVFRVPFGFASPFSPFSSAFRVRFCGRFFYVLGLDFLFCASLRSYLTRLVFSF